MRIESITLRVIKMPLVMKFETSSWKQEDRTAIIAEIRSGTLQGYGECVADEGPWYSYETVGTAWHILSEYMIPALLGKSIESPEQLLWLLQRIRGHNMARACLEMAFWDLLAKSRGVSLSKMFGGARDRVESGVSIGIQDHTPDLLKLIERFLQEGYRRIKIKIKPGRDVDVVQAVRDRFPEIPLMVDANSAYTLKDTSVFKHMEKSNLMMIEQPLARDDIVDHAQLQSEIKTPICLDESILSVEDARKAISMGSCRIINIKPGRVGGHLSSILIHNFCEKSRIPVWIGGMLETGIGRAHNAAIASLPNFRLPGDISASNRYFHEDIVNPPFGLNSDGTISVPNGPGIGVEIKHHKLKSLELRQQTWTA